MHPTPDFPAIRIPPQAWTRRQNDVPADPPKPVREGLHDGGAIQGFGLGGFGTGSIGRDFQGGFRRWTLKTGSLKHFLLGANAFAAWQRPDGGAADARVLYAGEAPARGLEAWHWPGAALEGSYHALFPKAWYHYPAAPTRPVAMTCEQFSPLLPGDYRASSLPVGVFRWELTNTADVAVDAALLFSFTNLVGWFTDYGRGLPLDSRRAMQHNRPVTAPLQHGELRGLAFERRRDRATPREGDGQMCIAARADADVAVTYHASFDPWKDGAVIWEPFAADGRLSDAAATWLTLPVCEMAGAVCARVRLAPGETRRVDFALSWDFPVIAFGSGREHLRAYTRHIGSDGSHAVALAAEALDQAAAWSAALDAWQGAIIAGGRPDWYYRLLFNEAYLIVDGFTCWTAGELGAAEPQSHFGIIECPDYPFYNTVDLWIYGSFVLLAHWPDIERQVIRSLAATVGVTQDDPRIWLWKGEPYLGKTAGQVPHDFGAPREDPFVTLNSYTWQNCNVWRDLNADFVLLLYRDVRTLGDRQLLADCYPALRQAMDRLISFDADGDGLIENTGAPDQTFDNIPLLGPGSYCNSLFLAALAAARDLAALQDDAAAQADYAERLDRAVAAFDATLWGGTHYLADTRDYRAAIFIEQLFGIGYAARCGLTLPLTPGRVQQALRTVFTRNFKPGLGVVNFSNLGADSSEAPETEFNSDDCQTHEVLSGINLAYAAHCDQAGLHHEADTVLHAIHDALYAGRGLWFRTPAAWNNRGDFRAILNLRPLVVWALEHDPGPDPLAGRVRHG